MNGVLLLFLLVGSIALGIGIGWYLRGRPEASPDTDPEVELRDLREIHASCGTKIRSLHIELSKLESALAMAGLQTERSVPAAVAPVGNVQRAESGAAHLASILGALGTDEPEQPDTADDQPAAFMSILPADLVEEGVKEATEPLSTGPATKAPEAAPESEPEPEVASEVVISLVDAESSVEIEVDRTDDLKEIKGIGPKIESILHDEGITTFQQIAELDDQTVGRLSDVLGAFRGRIERDDWIGSARELIAERSVSR